ncbi:DUF5123 domain-containing protein [Angustibacter sp. McL0619]|uniref:DUF5123 domain-containing protein n=1 Tax=Angustibacter sp. McL0619 TaxID=3415676 RepID=UPI003CEBC951
MTSRAVAVLSAVLLALVAGAAPAAAAAAATPATVVIVAPHGSDRAAGTAGHPMRTIDAALRRLPAGGRIELRGGVYDQRARLVGVHDVSLLPYRHEHPVLSGAGLVAPSGLTALIEIADSARVTVSGLDVTGYRTEQLDVTPAGIYVHGHDTAVRIVGNHVHDLGNDNSTLGSFDIDAHGIAVYGDDPQASVTDLAIDGNEVDHLHLGASESVVVNGNVDGWTIARNRIHDNDNIGIDAIGFEPTLKGAYRYTELNRARNGVIAENSVARIVSRGNPAYWEGGSGAAAWCNCANGIYVDGGTHIVVRDNVVTDDDIGIEVAAENPRGSADHVLVSHNVVTGSLFTGITTGGYCNGAEDCGDVRTGTSHDNVFDGNWLRGNNRLDDGSPELLVQYYSSDNTFTHNTIIATNSAHVVYGTVPSGSEQRNRSDHNSFSAVGVRAAQLEFGWSGHTYTGFAAYRHATGQDQHSTAR